MKELSHKNKKHPININRPHIIEKISSVVITKPLVACQPKLQPNVINFTHYAHLKSK